VVSGFRSRKLNTALFGSPESWHIADDDKVAVDIVCREASLKRIAETLDELKLPFDPLIIGYDRSVVHIQARRLKRESISRKIVGSVVRYQSLKDRA